MSKIFIWANSDMDGAASVILLSKVFSKFEYKSVFFGNFEEQYTKWASSNLEDYDKVFVVGMVFDQRLLDRIDSPRLVVFSDRGEYLSLEEGKIFDEECSSCCKLLFKKFKDTVKFSNNIVRLVAYVNDYNDYKLKHEESKYLNGLYRKTQYGRFDRFVKRFSDGYDGLTDSEMEKAEEFMNEIEEEMESIDFYTGLYKDHKVIAVFSKLSANEIAHHIMSNTDCEVSLVINKDTQFVSFRKPLTSTVNLAKMAERLCDGGGGEFSAGGKITKQFLEFSTKFEKL